MIDVPDAGRIERLRYCRSHNLFEIQPPAKAFQIHTRGRMFYDDLRDSSMGIEEKRNVRIIRILAYNRSGSCKRRMLSESVWGKYSIFISLWMA